MPCYHPLFAWEHIAFKTEKGKALIRFKAPEYEETELWKSIQLPCGTCEGCKLDTARHWAVRCMLEAKEHQHNYFVTLTYSNDTVPCICWTDLQKMEYCEEQTLCLDDLQKFMKRLREHYKRLYNHDNIRYFACGEYGEKGHRPHYHAIIFNLPIPDLKAWFQNSQKDIIYTSELLSKIWGKGIVTVGEVSYQSAGYVARYTLKKLHKSEFTNSNEKEEEFIVMSRKPGIAANYFKNNKEKIYKNDEIIVAVNIDKAMATKPPRYFDKLFDETNEEDLQTIKEKRRHQAQRIRDYKALHTTLTETEMLGVEERKKLASIKMLKRQLKDI